MNSKIFREEIDKYYVKIKNHENFAFVRYNDGEWYVFDRRFIDITKKYKGHIYYDPEDPKNEFFRNKLIESIKYKHSTYYVGIMTSCCFVTWKSGGHSLMKNIAEQNDDNLTYSSLFMNSNYIITLQKIIPLFKEFRIILIMNRKGNPKNLPFATEKIFYCGTNSWVNDYQLIEQVRTYIIENKIKNHLFLVCSGLLSNMMIHELHKTEKENIYLNFASGLDEYIYSEPTRWYHNNKNGFLEHVCTWG